MKNTTLYQPAVNESAPASLQTAEQPMGGSDCSSNSEFIPFPSPVSHYSTDPLLPIGPAFAPSAPPSVPRKSRRALWIILALMGVVLLAGGGSLLYFTQQSTPAKTLQAGCDALERGDYQAVYQLFTSHLQQQVASSEQGYVDGMREWYSSKGGMKSCIISAVQQNGSSASGVSVITYGDGSVETDTLLLVQ